MQHKIKYSVVEKNFSKHAHLYTKNAQIQKYSSYTLCKHALQSIKQKSKILDIGSGTGFISDYLTREMHDVDVFESDISLQMLIMSCNKTQKIVLDANELPFRHSSFDSILSSFCFQWISDLDGLFRSIKSILKQDGFFAFSIPTSNSLNEIRLASEQSGCNFSIVTLPSFEYVENCLKNYFQNIESHIELTHTWHKNPKFALKSIKNLGASYSISSNFISKNSLNEFSDLYYKKFSTNSLVPISWEVSYFFIKNNS